MRITGLATGLDVDEIVTSTMKAYRIKIQQTEQKRDVLEIKQKLYRDVIKEGKEFYSKYLDITSKDNVLLSKNYTSTKFESKDDSIVTAKGNASAIKDTYSVNVQALASSGKKEISASDLGDNNALEFEYKGEKVTVNLSEAKTDKERATILNKELSSLGLKASYSDFNGKITIETKETGATVSTKDENGQTVEVDNSFKISVGKITTTVEDDKEVSKFEETLSLGESSKGTNLKATITSSKGTVTYGDGALESKSNSVTLDGVTFTMNGVSTGAETTKVFGKTDVTEIKDKLVNFINDYNALITKFNTLTNEKRDSSYMPLTDDQKSEMSENEIKLWEEKVEKGQLARDLDITRIVNSMKRSFTTPVTGSNLTMEKIGISPVSDYTTKSGTFSIDEDKLTEALENDMEEVLKLFTSSPSDDEGISDTEKYNQTGMLYRLQSVFKSEFESSNSALAKKAGVEGTSTFSQNTLSKQIAAYEKKITLMESNFTKRETALYSKYASLETIMNNYNSQMSYLSSYFGTSY